MTWVFESAQPGGRGTGSRVAAILRMAGWVVLLLACGCRVVSRETTATRSFLQSLVEAPKGHGATNALEMLQAEVMRGADQYVAELAHALQSFCVRVPTPGARLEAQQWKLLEATSAYIDASGENPVLNAVDLAVLASLSRYVVENQWVGKEYGEAARPVLEAHTALEMDAWKRLEIVLSPAQIQSLRTLVDEYHQKYPDARFVAAIRLPELATALGMSHSAESTQRSGSILNLLYLDPLAGLDPATQAVEQTRLFAQRALYYAQRAPMLLGWQVELTTYQLAAQPESRQVLGDLNSVSGSIRSFARTSELLPGLIHTEREQALDQFFDGVARERTNLVAGLLGQEEALRGLLPQARETFDAGGGMATAVNAAIVSLDGFVRSVTAPDTHAPSGAPSRPFDVREYGEAANRVAMAARDLKELLESRNHLGPGEDRIAEALIRDAKALLDHAFRLGIALILAAGVVAVGVVAVSRRWRVLRPTSGTD